MAIHSHRIFFFSYYLQRSFESQAYITIHTMSTRFTESIAKAMEARATAASAYNYPLHHEQTLGVDTRQADSIYETMKTIRATSGYAIKVLYEAKESGDWKTVLPPAVKYMDRFTAALSSLEGLTTGCDDQAGAALIEPWNEAGSKMTHAFCSAAFPFTDPSTDGESDFNQQTTGEEAIKWPHVQKYFKCQRTAECTSSTLLPVETLPLLIQRCAVNCEVLPSVLRP
jgi:hypothetical protein